MSVKKDPLDWWFRLDMQLSVAATDTVLGMMNRRVRVIGKFDSFSSLPQRVSASAEGPVTFRSRPCLNDITTRVTYVLITDY